MKVFVAGATRAVGQPLVRQLREAGHEVSAVSRYEENAQRLRSEGVDAHVGDALDRERMREILRTAEPEVVVHQLTTFPSRLRPVEAFRKLRQTNRLRTEGTRLFVDLAGELGVRRVIAQSIAFGYRPLREHRRATEDDPYFSDARGALGIVYRPIGQLESTVTGSEHVEGVALRYGGWYGPGTHFGSDGLAYRAAMKRRFPVVNGVDARINLVHVDDAAGAVVAALEGPTGVFNIVDDEPLPIAELADVYRRAIGAPAPRVFGPWVKPFLGKYNRQLLLHQVPASNERARAELGWRPRYPTFRDGVEALGA